MHARERRQLRLFVRRDTYGRYVSVPGLPAPRPLQHRGPRAVRRDPHGATSAASTSSSPPGSASRRPPACTSWSTRPRASSIPDVDVADLERRLTEASRSWRDDFAGRRRQRVRRGARRRGWPRATPTRSPRPTRRTSRPQRGAADLGRLEAIDGRRGHRPVALRAGRRRLAGEARLKVFRIGAPLSLSRGAADADLDGRRGRRRAALRARRASTGPSYIYEFGLRYGRRCPTHARELFRTRCARCGTATTRSTASTRWCSPPG